MRAWWGVLVVVGLAMAGPANENDHSGNTLDDSLVSGLAGAAVGNFFGPQLRTVLGALEDVDEFMRSTIPNVDRFQCVERMLCSMMASDPNSQSPVSGLLQGIQSLLDPTSQENTFGQDGFFQQPSFAQGFPQQPAFQQGFAQQPAFQQGFVQQPGFQQGFVQQPAFQQAFGPAPVGSLSPQFQQPPSQFVHGGFQSLSPVAPSFRENTGEAVERNSNHQPQPVRRRPIRRRQRNGFLDFLRNIGLGKRKKRSLLEDIFSGFTGERIMGLVDQMMNKYSFYPYTHAAFMGYSGNPNRCETLYPSCPTTAEEMIDVFNNIHRHYPEGIPYRDRMPWPLNLLLP